jgi:OOP family OmpA-OmpF porin
MSTKLIACLLTCLVGLSAAAVRAQGTAAGFAIDRFEPSERGSEWFVLDTLDLRGRVRPAVGVVGDYALKPLVFYDRDGNEARALVKRQLFLHVGASLVLFDRLRLGINLPVAAMVQGESGAVGNVRYDVAEGGQLGDLRFSADVRLFGTYRGPLTMSAGLALWAPTGSPDAYTGDGKVRLSPHANLAGEISIFSYAARLGLSYRAQDGAIAGAQFGSEFSWGVSAGVRLLSGKLLLGPEIYGSTTFKDAFHQRTTPFEGVLGAHYRIQDFRVGAGAGPGFTEGLGSPKLRVVASLEWVPGSGDDPRAQKQPGRADSDGDGIYDDEDACPKLAGAPSDDPLKHGCPVHDRDADGIVDELDACPEAPGNATDDPKTNGCPDTDGDGILDPKDACPRAKGPKHDDPEKNGCPPARIEEGQIRILEQVQFKHDSAEILPVSEPTLQAVLAILNAHAEITRISVEGHTDNVGTAAYNKTLSHDRAESVVQWLVAHGVASKRLTSTGFGLELPIAPNDTDKGREKNRRVEFHIREVRGVPADDSGKRISP